MFHYTYRITYTNGQAYIGVRSCHCSPEQDTSYLGSSKYTQSLQAVRKEILGTFPTRKAAISHEIELHAQFDVARSPDFVNRSRQTTTKFDTRGTSLPRTEQHNAKIRAALTGRKRSPAECAAISKAKKGKPHRPHSEKTKEKQSKARLGTPGYKKGEHYDPEHHVAAYASRTKYSAEFHWVHRPTGKRETATCMFMGQRYGLGIKPTGRFRNIVRGVTQSYRGWGLDTEAT